MFEKLRNLIYNYYNYIFSKKNKNHNRVNNIINHLIQNNNQDLRDCNNCVYEENDILWVEINSGNNLLEINYPIDVNGDNTWDILDILLTINFIMGNIVPNPDQNIYADINQDDIIDIIDIIMMVNYILIFS